MHTTKEVHDASLEARQELENRIEQKDKEIACLNETIDFYIRTEKQATILHNEEIAALVDKIEAQHKKIVELVAEVDLADNNIAELKEMIQESKEQAQERDFLD